MENTTNTTAEFVTVTLNNTSDFTPLIDIKPIYTTKEAALPIIKKVAKRIVEEEGLGGYVKANPDHDFADMLSFECQFFDVDVTLFTLDEWRAMAKEFIAEYSKHYLVEPCKYDVDLYLHFKAKHKLTQPDTPIYTNPAAAELTLKGVAAQIVATYGKPADEEELMWFTDIYTYVLSSVGVDTHMYNPVEWIEVARKHLAKLN